MTKKEKNKTKISEEDQHQKIQSLRDMISSAEKTIQGAKAMLLQLEGKKKSGRRKKIDTDQDGTIIQGTFDGQIMIGEDGKQYPVPANYASKSKLVEGDMLKLTILEDGSFVYKQIGPADRKHFIGIASQDENGNYFIVADGKPYHVLLASITYFKVEPGDEVSIVTPKDIESSWAAVENVIQKNEGTSAKTVNADVDIAAKDKTIKEEKSIIDEWAPDIEAIEKEIKADQVPAKNKLE